VFKEILAPIFGCIEMMNMALEQQSQTSRLPSRYFEFGMLTEKSGVFAFGIMKMEVLSLDWTKLSLTKVKVPGTD
jgi:hypothetical protein